MPANSIPHKRTRVAHSSEIAEDYVEAIRDVMQTGVCRAVDLVKHFGVSAVTVNRTLARLQRDGLVETTAYGPIELTGAGEKLADFAKMRHQVVIDFLVALGVSPATALIDSEGMEHHVSRETLQAMKGFLATKQHS